MARSPLEQDGLPGQQVLSFLADACVFRTRAFYEAGGFWPRLASGGEERLLALDMADRGWRMVYVEDVRLRMLRSLPTAELYPGRLAVRDVIWVAWMRLPVRLAWKETRLHMRSVVDPEQLRALLMSALGGTFRVVEARHVVQPRVVRMCARLLDQAADSREDPAGPPRQSIA